MLFRTKPLIPKVPGGLIHQGVENFKNKVQSVGNTIHNSATKVVNGIKSTVGEISNDIKTTAVTLHKDARDAIIGMNTNLNLGLGIRRDSIREGGIIYIYRGYLLYFY